MSRMLLTVAAVLTLAGPPVRAQASDFHGRIFDAATRDGIQNLQVKLTPPKQSTAPIRIANTARDGSFVFGQLVKGRYLVEVSQGVDLLYRAEVDSGRSDRLDVPLRRK